MDFSVLANSFDGLVQARDRIAARPVSPEALEVLRANSGDDALTRKNLEALSSGAAQCILTGQQLGLFLGPAFTLYKISSALALAKQLSEKFQAPVVPIFWLQAEDHDFDEIRSIQTPYSSEKFELQKAAIDERSSVGGRVLSNEILNVLSNLETEIGPLPLQMSLLREAYKPGATITSAFSDLVRRIFSDSGLLIYDPQHTQARKLAAPSFYRSLEEFREIEKAVQSRTQELVAAGHPEQVALRQDSPLFFIHFPDAAGSRFRLKWSQGRFHAIGADYVLEKEELATIMREQPERISSSALLRPLIQDSIFPTLAYIGGDAERRYLLQIGEVYEQFGLRQPALVRRLSAVVVDPKLKRLLKDLSLQVSDVLRPTKEIEAAIYGCSVGPQELQVRVDAQVQALLKLIREETETVSPQMTAVLRRTQDKFQRATSGVIHRYALARENQSDVRVQRYRSALDLVSPGGFPQERVFAGLSYWLKCGAEFLEGLNNESSKWAETLSPEMRIISLGS